MPRLCRQYRLFIGDGACPVSTIGPKHFSRPIRPGNAALTLGRVSKAWSNRAEGRIAMALWKGFQNPKRLAVDTETLNERYGRFWAQPFERGFGTTVGNALRRVLLSSIEGAAVTAVKIEGVLHEFSPIQGVVEDATDIILNLKQIPFKLNGDGPKAIYLRADQPGVITSGMIEADGDVEVLDKT